MDRCHVINFIGDRMYRTKDPEERTRLSEARFGVDQICDREKVSHRAKIPVHLLEEVRKSLAQLGIELPQEFPLRQRIRWYCEDTM